MLRYAIITCVLITCEGFAVPHLSSNENRIIDGTAIDIEKAPYLAQYEHVGIPTCGAVIISPAYALTAAHCTVRSLVSLVTIRVGSSTRAHGGTAHSAVFIIRHERYTTSPTVQYDVAIVRVASVFMYDARVQPAALSVATPLAGTRAVVAGWGAAQEGGQPSTTLRSAGAAVEARAACNATLGGRLGAGMLCAAPGAALCPHDMGGGLVAAGGGGALLGVASWGAGCGRADSPPAVYVDVAAVRDWLREHCGV